MENLYVDTSGWIEVFGKKSPLHKQAREILDYVIDEHRQIITTNYVITEFVASGCAKCDLTRDRLFEAIDNISQLPNIEIVHIGEKSHALALTRLRGLPDKEWSLVDAAGFIVMEQRGIREALTTDHHFEQANFIKLL